MERVHKKNPPLVVDVCEISGDLLEDLDDTSTLSLVFM